MLEEKTNTFIIRHKKENRLFSLG